LRQRSAAFEFLLRKVIMGKKETDFTKPIEK
jgi:hypothetical protein